MIPIETLYIRPAEEQDFKAITALCEQLGYPSEEKTIQDRLIGLNANSATIILVAETETGQVVGWIQGVINTFLMTGRYVELAGLVVDENHRSQKIGEKLVAALENWARQTGNTKISLRSNAIRTNAHRFYLNLGYAQIKTSCIFEKTLSERAARPK